MRGSYRCYCRGGGDSEQGVQAPGISRGRSKSHPPHPCSRASCISAFGYNAALGAPEAGGVGNSASEARLGRAGSACGAGCIVDSVWPQCGGSGGCGHTRGRKCEWRAAVCVGTAGHFKRACHPLNNVSIESLSLAGMLHFKNPFGSWQVWEEEKGCLGALEWGCCFGTRVLGRGCQLQEPGCSGVTLKCPFDGATVPRSELRDAAGPGGGRVAPCLGHKPQLPPTLLPSLCLLPSQDERGKQRERARGGSQERRQEVDHRREGSGTSLPCSALKPLPAPWLCSGSAAWGGFRAPSVLRDLFPGAPDSWLPWRGSAPSPAEKFSWRPGEPGRGACVLRTDSVHVRTHAHSHT